MTTDPVLLSGVVAGTVLTFAYVIVAGFPADALNKSLVFFLSSAGIAAGIKVCLLSLDPDQLQELSNERIYTFLGGLAVSWVSGESIIKIFSEHRQDRKSSSNDQIRPNDNPISTRETEGDLDASAAEGEEGTSNT